jgi:hypothetical protein
VVPGLVERHLAALDQRIDADLELGRHHDLVAELRELTDRHRLREHFWGQRMLALHRSGRQAEALDSYREIAKILAEELGIDPGARPRDLHQQILATDASRSAPVPRQLPTRTPHFVGRAGELRQLGDYRDLAGETVIGATGSAPSWSRWEPPSAWATRKPWRGLTSSSPTATGSWATSTPPSRTSTTPSPGTGCWAT